MEDSKIIWYIVLGAIWFLSKFFNKKKKKPDNQAPYADEEYEPEVVTEKQKPSSFDDILKELSKEVGYEEATPKAIPVEEVEESKPLVSEITPLPSYPPKEINIYNESKKAHELPTKEPTTRDKMQYGRSENFAIVEEENEIANDLHDLLQDENGPKKAMILSEILNRKY